MAVVMVVDVDVAVVAAPVPLLQPFGATGSQFKYPVFTNSSLLSGGGGAAVPASCSLVSENDR